jgi:hypothetical protein
MMAWITAANRLHLRSLDLVIERADYNAMAPEHL